MQETQVRSLGQEDPLEKGMATHFRILAWRIPWTPKCALQITATKPKLSVLILHPHPGLSFNRGYSNFFSFCFSLPSLL